MAHTGMHIEVVSDIVCPWCYIGKRRLEAALQLFAHAHPDQATPRVSWLPFQLNPDMPEAGMRRAEYLQRKFGTPDGGSMYARVSTEARKEGLVLDFASITRQPNTLKAHAMLAAAEKTDSNHSGAMLQGALKEALMRAYFCEGADLTQDATLEHIANQAGLPPDVSHAVLQDAGALRAASDQDAELRRHGVQGVPFFIFNRKTGVSGAQPAEALLAAMEHAALGAKAE
jgi:predicted DsbA family dithiol-disulfide isomerase